MSGASIARLVQSARPCVPQIYAYTTPEIARHDGWTKIGYTEQNVEERIAQQAHTVDVRTQLEWHGNALYEDGSGAFRDTDFHAYLTRLGIGRERATEWFHVTGSISKGHFRDFRENKGVIGTSEPQPYTLRDVQERAVAAAEDYARGHEGGEFLWNAKPRFGKTLAAYELMQRLDAKTVLIVTNRPAIACSWYDDYEKFVGAQGGYRFVSEVDALEGKPACLTRKEYLAALDGPGPKRCIEFVSLQDLKGSVHFGGGFDKLGEVADITWDLLIVDEAHEGVDTYKTDVAFERIKRHFTLHLSGTPFKALANEKFPADAIFNWTYADEQQAKRAWADPERANPYAELPQLNLFTYQLSEVALEQAQRGIQIDGQDVAYAFDLNEFFATKARADGAAVFVHDAEVDRFLDALTTQEKFPFSTPELRDELRHTFWLLNHVASAKALARKLREHPVFCEYEVVVAAGDGKADEEEDGRATTAASLENVRKAIAAHDKTIILSVGQLTTGVTVPEWTAVLMLSNVKSPALYMQAAFRAQNPCLFVRDGQFPRKENAYVFDFDPARTLTIFEQFANDLYADTAAGVGDMDARKQRVRTLLNFFPVIGEDEKGAMVRLDAERVLSIPRRIRSHEVVRRGFMCDFLFQNISRVFRAPAEVLDVIQSFEPCKAPSRDLGIGPGTADELALDAAGEVVLPDEQVVGIAAGLFGEKVYESTTAALDEAIEEAVLAQEAPGEDDGLLERLNDAFATHVTESLIAAARERYADVLGPAQQRRIERRIRADAGEHFAREVGACQITCNEIELERAAELDMAGSMAEAGRINERFDAQVEDAMLDLGVRLEAACGELVKGAGETIAREAETAKSEAVLRSKEGGIRDHLRGFTRTIPSFLMAYGTAGTTLATFEEAIPPEVFEEVTSITVEQFRFLRDGGDFVNPETGELEHFEGQLFDPVVFDDAVREFIALRGSLANYLDANQEEDIFDYVPPQKTNQIFTPKRVVTHMVDLFEQENPGCFDDPTHTFADLYMKSGLFITEAIKRLYNSEGLRRAFPDNRARLDHILEHQVFGIAPTEIIYQIATHYILGYDDEVGAGCAHNFVCADSAQMAKDGTLAAFVEEKFGEVLGEG